MKQAEPRTNFAFSTGEGSLQQHALITVGASYLAQNVNFSYGKKLQYVLKTREVLQRVGVYLLYITKSFHLRGERQALIASLPKPPIPLIKINYFRF